MRQKVSKAIFTAALAAVIFIIVAKNTGGGQSFFSWIAQIPNHDKIGHFILMGGLTFLAVVAFSASAKRPRHTTLLIILLMLVGTGIEEISQIWIRNRTFSGWDYLCDFAGISCMGMLAYAIIHLRAKTSS